MANNVDFSQQELFTQAFKYAPIGMALVSTEGQWLHVNSSLCQTLGYSESEFLDRTFQDITHPDDLSRSLEVRDQLLEHKMDCFQMEKRYIHKNGFPVWVLMAVSILKDELKRPLFFITQIKDITENKLAELDLRRSKESLAIAAHIAQIGTWEADIKTGEVHWSNEFSQILELNHNEINPSYELFISLVHPDDRNRVDQIARQALQGKPYDLEHRIIRGNGEERIIHSKGTVTWDESGIPLRMHGIIHDITDRLQEQNSLRTSEELFKLIAENAQDIITISTLEGRVEYISPAVHRLLGYKPDEILGTLSHGTFHPEDLATIANLNLFQDSDEDTFECRVKHKDGHYIPFETTVNVIRDEQGRPLKAIGVGRDISGRKQVEEKVRKTKERFESVIQNNADAIWLVDLEDKLIEVNPSFETMFGWPAKEVIGKKLPMIPDYLKDSMEKIHHRVKSGETVVSLATTRQRKDGILLEVEATLSPIRDNSGNIVGMTGICRDVTRRKRAEQELKAKTEQLESFIKHNADAIWMIDKKDTLIEINPSFEALFGWSAKEVIGKELPMIPDFLKDSMEKIHESVKTGQTVVGLETIRQRKDGKLLDVEATLSPLRDRDGNVIGITGICRDVTRRTLAEEELKAKTVQLESFIENNADAILIFNNEGFVERINQTFQKIFGWSKEDTLGIHLHSLPTIPTEYLDEMVQMCKQVKTGQTVIGAETIRKCKSGELLNVLLTISPILDGKGNNKGWSVSLRDITESKKAQEHLQNSEKLSVAGQLAAGIAHEIRNPITSIKGFIQLMKSGFGEKQKYFDIMTSEIERIELILSELLILAKPQSIKFKRNDIRVLLSQVTTLLDTQAILNNVQFVTEFKPGIIHIYCDENQLKQVFINFIKNSIESMPKGGRITIQIDSDNDQEMLIRLIDQGCGIPKEVLSKLGQPFYTTKEKGTGLGFMVSKKIIENHSGKIHVESQLNKGTTIEIRLPIDWS